MYMLALTYLCIVIANDVTHKLLIKLNNMRDRRGRDRMVVGFATTYVISIYHH